MRFEGFAHPVRDALIIRPRPGQASGGLRAIVSPADGDEWTLEITSDVALRYVAIEAAGWTPSDDVFHLPAAAPYCVRLRRFDGPMVPIGKVSSVDCVVSATITAET